MAHLVGDLAKYFQIDEINIDNWYFKLFYKGCTLVYFIGSMVGLLSQYFGDPINCDFSGVDVSEHAAFNMIVDLSGLQGDPSGWLKPPVDLVPTAQAPAAGGPLL